MKKTKKVKILIPGLLLLMLTAAAMPVMAIGPEQAAEVDNNPNLSIGTSTDSVILDTPSGVHDLWIQSSGHFNHWINASVGGGKINNAVTVGPTADVTLAYLLTHVSEFENRWIYFSQSIFSVYLRFTDVPDYAAVAAQYPDGIYWHFVYVG